MLVYIVRLQKAACGDCIRYLSPLKTSMHSLAPAVAQHAGFKSYRTVNVRYAGRTTFLRSGETAGR
jgi:hypothetical protein